MACVPLMAVFSDQILTFVRKIPVEKCVFWLKTRVEHTMSLWNTHNVSAAHTVSLCGTHTEAALAGGRAGGRAADSRESLSPLDLTLPPPTHPPKNATPPLRGDKADMQIR